MSVKLTLAATGDFQTIILKYLEENASDVLAEKINKGKKTLAGCQKYIFAEAKKKASQNVACIEDAEVFGWAVHYFEEDEIKENKLPAVTATVANAEGAEKPKKEPSKQRTGNATVAPKEQKKAKVAPQYDDSRLSLFDLLGGDEL